MPMKFPYNNEFLQSRSTHGTQQAVLSHNGISQRGSLRGNLYQLLTKSNVDSPPETGGSHLSQMPLMNQQHYPSCPPRNKDRNGERFRLSSW